MFECTVWTQHDGAEMSELFCLVTMMLDPDTAPMAELADATTTGGRPRPASVRSRPSNAAALRSSCAPQALTWSSGRLNNLALAALLAARAEDKPIVDESSTRTAITGNRPHHRVALSTTPTRPPKPRPEPPGEAFTHQNQPSTAAETAGDHPLGPRGTPRIACIRIRTSRMPKPVKAVEAVAYTLVLPANSTAT